MLVQWWKKKRNRNGKIVFICAPALNYAIHKDANVLNISVQVENVASKKKESDSTMMVLLVELFG